MLRTKSATFALLAVLLAACTSPATTPEPSPSATPSITPSGEIDSIDEARAVWGASGIADYTYTISRDCFCTSEWSGPFAVQVRDGVSTVTRVSDGSAVIAPTILEQLPLSAEDLFQFAEERQDQASFRITYDQATGLPLSIWSDPIPEAADDELGVQVSDLTLAP
ncbi:MAG: DUF6174 domain-containing protein [Candidatus Limnocylindrus sp.]